MPKRAITAVLLAMLTGVVVLIGAPVALAAPEAPVTKPATGVTATTATVNGELNPHSEAKTGYYFAYATGGTCTEGAASEPQGEGEAPVKALKVSASLKELVPDTNYSFCLVATHQEGETLEATIGNQLAFKTAAVKPAVEAERTSGVTPFEGRLEAEVNPENESTSCKFEYGPTATYGKSVPCEPETLEGYGSQTPVVTLTGLKPSTTAHFRVVLKNATGETKGPDSEFTTLPAEAPVISGESTSDVTDESAELHAAIDPDYQETVCKGFVYWPSSKTQTEGTTVACAPEELGAGSEPVGVAAQIKELAPDTAYDYRVIASNKTGTREGPVETFTTVTGPTATDTAALGITRTTAIVSGTVNPGGTPTSYYFAYVDEAGYEAGTAAGDPYLYAASTPVQTAGESYAPQETGPITLTELTAGTTYHYALIASNSVTTETTPDQSFTTSPKTPPAAATGEAQNITPTSATITGSVNTQGLPTTMQLQLGTSPGQGATRTITPSGQSGNTLSISTTIAGLQPETAYYYTITATNTDGATTSNTTSFTTTSYPAPFTLTAPPPALTYPTITQLNEKEAKEHPKPPTRQQLLKKALKTCRTKHNKHKRTTCEKQAQHKYGTTKKTKK